MLLLSIYDKIKTYWNENEVNRVIEKLHQARDFALMAHGSQMYGDKPYIFHLDSVVLNLLLHKCTRSVDYIQGGYLHDALEDTVIYGKKVSYNDLRREFGFSERVCDLVYAVTDGKGKVRKQKKAIMYNDLHDYPDAIPLKLADTIANATNSLKEGADTLEMYVKEFPNFKKIFYKEEHGSLWCDLEEVIFKAQSINK